MIQCLSVINVREIIWTYTLRHSRIPDLYAEVEVDGERFHTAVVKMNTNPDWKQKIDLFVV